MRSVWVKIAFLTMGLWWAYLFFTTEFIVVFDAQGYEDLGRTIAHQGWAEYLRSGPQREPLFPWLVSVSMRLGNWWGISYHYPLKMIGMLFLLLTLIFSYRLMRMLSISRPIAYAAVFYLGISPTMISSSLRLWSEFAAYPWVVLAVIWTIKSWELLGDIAAERKENLKIAGHAVMVAFMFLLVMSVKAPVEGALFFYLGPFYWRVFSCWRSGNFIKARQAAIFCLIVLIVFEGVVCAYKSYNYHYNGHFAFTNRGDQAFYGNTARRMQPLTMDRLGAAVAFVPGMGICPALFSQDDCNFWTARYSDDIITAKAADLNSRGIRDGAAAHYFIHDSIKMIFSNPLQALLLMFIEAHKMFFWEPCIGFEVYPDWLERAFNSPLYFYMAWFGIAFLSWISCAFAFFYLCRRQDGALLWVVNFIFWYMAVYSLFFIQDRYAFPLVALYMVLIAFLIQRIIGFFAK